MGPYNESNQSPLGFIVDQVSAPQLFAEPPTLVLTGNLGQLRYRPAAGATGTSTIRVRLQDDGGTAHGGIDTSSPRTVTITVLPIGVFSDGFE
jgi:hypothetical protein